MQILNDPTLKFVPIQNKDLQGICICLPFIPVIPQKRLAEFKKKIKARLIQFWKNKEDLHGKFSISLMKAITANPRTGWVRASEIAGPEVTKELTRLSSENATLRTQIEVLLRAGEGHQDEVRETIKILSNNQRSLKVRKTGKWDEATRHPCSLADIFHYAAPNLISENTSLGVSQNIALKLAGSGYYPQWPIGRNIVSDMIADLAALDLVEPSKKKHSVSDTDDYWSLTKLGKQVLKEFRRVRLEEGISSSAEPLPENS